MLPKCVLHCSRQGSSGWSNKVKQLVKHRIKCWKRGDLLDLWSEACSDTVRVRRKGVRAGEDSFLRAGNASRARGAVGDGQYRKAVQSLTSNGVAFPSGKAYLEMVAKHPQVALPSRDHPPPQSIKIQDLLVVKALKSFPAGTSPGPSGLRAAHLKEALSCPSPRVSTQFLSSLTLFISNLAAGQAPASVVPHLCGASLTALTKPSGGLRPIAVGEVLRRLTSKCLSFSLSAEAAQVLSPLQLGVGVRFGCEAIVHSINFVLDDSSIPPTRKWVLQVDFSNAFNCVARSCIFKEVRDRFRSISAWIESCYGSRPLLHFGKHILYSCAGVQQGDPLDPLCFALALHPIIEQIDVEVPELLVNVWYLDDGTLCGTKQDLLRALKIIEEEGPTRGLLLNRSKSLLFIPPDSEPADNCLPSNIPTTCDGFMLLGSPNGSSSFCSSHAMKRVEKIQSALHRLPDMNDSHMEFVLLWSCLSLPKFNFIMRTCPPTVIHDAIQAFDASLHDSTSMLVGAPLHKWAWDKATLPVSMGGLGLR